MINSNCTIDARLAIEIMNGIERSCHHTCSPSAKYKCRFYEDPCLFNTAIEMSVRALKNMEMYERVLHHVDDLELIANDLEDGAFRNGFYAAVDSIGEAIEYERMSR